MTNNLQSAKELYWRWRADVKRLLREPLDYRACQAIVAGKRGIEIGGPSRLFQRDFPIYQAVGTLDGVNFNTSTIWEGQLTEGPHYRYLPERLGYQYISDATNLSRLSDESYDFVLSSNNLEHIANPLKALEEWLRIIRPGGHLLLVLPRKESNFDHLRNITPFRHLLDDFEAGVTEHDLTHLDEILKLHDHLRDPLARGPDAFRRRSLANFENRCLHHHVFDPVLIGSMFNHFGLKPLLALNTPINYIAIAQKGA